MAKKNIDLRKLFVPVRLHNQTLLGAPDPAFDTTDIAYLRSVQEVTNILQEKRKKSVSDFALSNSGRQARDKAEDGKPAGIIMLRCTDHADNFIGIDASGSLGSAFNANDRALGSPVCLDIDIDSLISAQSESEQIKVISKTTEDGTEKHFIELGQYPASCVSPDLQWKLEEAYNNGNLLEGMTCTGLVYTTNGKRDGFVSKQNPEFEFNGEKYVRVVVIRDSGVRWYSDGTPVTSTGSVVWHKVEPVSLEIHNWNALPRSINPRGRMVGGAKVIKTETEQCILSGIPFYPYFVRGGDNIFWQNSLWRAFFGSAKTSELDGNPNHPATIPWDFSQSGFLYQAFDMTREPLREYTIPETEIKICNYAFTGCVGIEKIYIPSHVTEIGKQAFEGCVNCQIIFDNPNKALQVHPNALDGTYFKLAYFSKDGKTMTFSPKEDPVLEKTCFKINLKKEEFSKFFSSNYRENFMQVNSWKESGKVKFIPPEFTLKVFPSSEMEKYFVGSNNKRWGKLVKVLGFDTLEGTEKTNSLVDLMKIYYAIGGFSENQGESERAFDYILKYVAVSKSQNPSPSDIGAEIHARFSRLSLKGRYNPDFAKFFMRYYKDNPDFMNFRLYDKDGELMDSHDYLCAAHNAFARIQKANPSRVVSGNEERSLLSPRFVAERCNYVVYDYVEEGNELLAEMAGRYDYSQELFDEMQKVYEQAKKLKDKYVISADRASDKNGISFRVLEKDDALGFFLGDLSNSCQHKGGAADSCVDDGYLNPEAGFLVFEESVLDEFGQPTGEVRLLGQAYVWYDPETKTVCYDNIEIPTKILDELRRGDRHNGRLSSEHFMDAVVESADAVMSSMNKRGIKVDRVTTGQGYNDLIRELEQRFGAPEKPPKAVHRGYSGYTDADRAQYVIRTYDETTRLYADAIREIRGEIEKDLNEVERSTQREQ